REQAQAEVALAVVALAIRLEAGSVVGDRQPHRTILAGDPDRDPRRSRVATGVPHGLLRHPEEEGLDLVRQLEPIVDLDGRSSARGSRARRRSASRSRCARLSRRAIEEASGTWTSSSKIRAPISAGANASQMLDPLEVTELNR